MKMEDNGIQFNGLCAQETRDQAVRFQRSKTPEMASGPIAPQPPPDPTEGNTHFSTPVHLCFYINILRLNYLYNHITNYWQQCLFNIRKVLLSTRRCVGNAQLASPEPQTQRHVNVVN